MPRGIPKAGKRVRRVYRPDLSEHFALVHARNHLGIYRFNAGKTRAKVAQYEFDDDGDMYIGRNSWVNVRDGDKGKFIQRNNRRSYLHDFERPPANPYA